MTVHGARSLSGAQAGRLTGLSALVARAMAADLGVFVIPGEDVARARGLDLRAVGLRISDTPRHASVLLIAGPLPPALLDAACVVWAQMPRPRAILALDAGDIAPLPAPDAIGGLSQEGLATAVADLRRVFAAGAFASDVTDFDAPALSARIEYTCPMHPEVVSDKPGKCPKCGMFLVEREVSGSAPASHEHHEKPAGKSAPAAHSHHADHIARAGTKTYTCPMHPEVTSDKPSSCPKCGMDLVPQEAASGHDQHATDRDVTAYTCPMHPEVVSDTPGSCPKCGMDLVPQGEAEGHAGHAGHGQDHGAHGGPGQNGGHGGHGGGHAGHEGHRAHTGHGSAPEIPGIEPHFMSMVELTEGKPASPDGLIMEWIDAPFGPFFPGLPGGLSLEFTLDGDTVVEARIGGLAGAPVRSGTPLTELADRLAEAAPLTPVAMRALALRAIAAATRAEPPQDAAAIEAERIASHLNWLAGFARQTGLAWHERQAAQLHRAVLSAGPDGIAALEPPLRRFLHRVTRTRLLRLKLAGIGRLVAETGPAARAAGRPADARADDPAYSALDFAPVTSDGGDALARLMLRCAEIGQSLDLIARAGAAPKPTLPTDLPESGHGMATVETPRGPAKLHLMIEAGAVKSAHLTTHFDALVAEVSGMVSQMELADALVAIGSLDLDPWGAGA